MKAPAFQLYPQDFISSLDVQLMSAAEVGAYCLLLFNSWTQPRQGFLPNDEAQLRHLSRLSSEEWKTSKKKLLAKFPATDDKKHRYNPRLLVEAEKQAAFREKQAEHGKLGGRPKRDEKPDKAKPFLGESQKNPSLSQPLGKPNPARAHSSSSSSISSASTADAVPHEATAAAGEPLKAKTKSGPMLDEDEPTFDFASSFFNTDKWPAVVADVRQTSRYAEADFDHYRVVIGLADDTAPQMLPNRHWRKKLMNWLENDAASKNGLVKPVATSQPKGRAINEITFELNPTAVARRRREAEEMERTIVAANLERINRREGTNFQVSSILGNPSA